MSGPCPAPLRRPTSSCRPRSPWCRASSRSSPTRGRSRTSSTTPAPRRSRSRVRRRSSDDTATRPVPCGENRRRHTETQHTTGSHGSGGLGATAAGVGSAGCGGGGGSQSRSAGRVGSAGGGGGWNRTVAVGGVLPGCVCVCVCVACMGVGGKGARRLSSDFFSSSGRFSWGVSPHGPEARFWCEPSAHHSRRHAQVEVPVQKLFPWGRVSEAGQLSYKICVFQAPLRGPGASWTTDTRSWCEPSAHPRPRHAQIRR